MVISKFFGDDTVPKCNTACDVCKNPIYVKKLIDKYHKGIQLHSSKPVKFNSAACFDVDTSDLYEGGRYKRKRFVYFK